MKRLALLALLLAPSTGCVLYFGDDGDDCANSGGAAKDPAQGQRNPQSGQCEFFGGGGGGGGRPGGGGGRPGGGGGGGRGPKREPRW
jgi:hypothetical protein